MAPGTAVDSASFGVGRVTNLRGDVSTVRSALASAWGRGLLPWSRMKGVNVAGGMIGALLLSVAGCGSPPIPRSPFAEGTSTEDPPGTTGDDGLIDPTTGGGGETPGTTGPSGDTTGADTTASPTTTGEPPPTDSTDDDAGSESGGESSSGGPAESESSGEPPPDCDPILAEVMYDISGEDDGLEWIRLYNPCAVAVDLSAYSLGWGGTDYTYGTLDLVGSLDAGACTVVGGPTANADNGNPVYGQAVNLEPDPQNSGGTADGVALFVGAAADITMITVPVDAVIYGGANNSGLLDATGAAPAPHVGDAGSGDALRRTGMAAWEIGPPNPTECPPF